MFVFECEFLYISAFDMIMQIGFFETECKNSDLSKKNILIFKEKEKGKIKKINYNLTTILLPLTDKIKSSPVRSITTGSCDG